MQITYYKQWQQLWLAIYIIKEIEIQDSFFLYSSFKNLYLFILYFKLKNYHIIFHFYHTLDAHNRHYFNVIKIFYTIYYSWHYLWMLWEGINMHIRFFFPTWKIFNLYLCQFFCFIFTFLLFACCYVRRIFFGREFLFWNGNSKVFYLVNCVMIENMGQN